MDISKIRNKALTEDAKMGIIEEVLDGGASGVDLDKVLANGNKAVGKDATFQKTAGDNDNASFISFGTFSTSKRLENGTATAQITAEGSLFLDYQPDDGQLTFLHIRVDGGTPRVMMSDNMKAAFKAELGIS